MKAKKFLAVLTTLVMIFCLSGCAQKGEKEAEKIVKDADVTPKS